MDSIYVGNDKPVAPLPATSQDAAAAAAAAASQPQQPPFNPQQPQSTAAPLASAPASASSSALAPTQPTPQHLLSLLETSKLLSLACEHNRADIIGELLGNLPPPSRALLLNPLPSQLPYSGLHFFPPNDPSTPSPSSFVCPPPPLHVSVSRCSTAASAILLRFGADPSVCPPSSSSSYLPLKYVGKTAWRIALGLDSKARQAVANTAFGSELLRCSASNDAKRVEQFLDAGLKPRDLDAVVEGGGGDDDGGEQSADADAGKAFRDFASSVGAKDVVKLFDDRFGGNKRGGEEPQAPSGAEAETDAAAAAAANTALADTPPSAQAQHKVVHVGVIEAQHRALQESSTLLHVLASTFDELSEECVMTSELLLGGGAASLGRRVKSFKVELSSLDRETKSRHESLLDLLADLSYLGEPSWRALFIDEDGNLKDVLSEAPLPPPSMPADADMSQLLRDSAVKVATLRASLANLAEEHAKNQEALDKQGLSGALKHYRNLREELKDTRRHVAALRIVEAKCRERLTFLDERGKAPTPPPPTVEETVVSAPPGSPVPAAAVVAVSAAGATAVAAAPDAGAISDDAPTPEVALSSQLPLVLSSHLLSAQDSEENVSLVADAYSAAARETQNTTQSRSTLFSIVIQILFGVDIFMQPIPQKIKMQGEKEDVRVV